MMFKKRTQTQEEFIMMRLEDMVPQEHLLRKVERAIDLNFINDVTQPLYSQDKGRHCIEPVILFKIVLLQSLYGIKSMRATIKQCETDAAFRWFLVIPFGQSVPHYSTFSQNYRRRFAETDVFETIFETIIHQAIKHHLISGRDLFTDSTHIKANANKRKLKEEITTYVKDRKVALEAEINQTREELGKEGFDFEDHLESKTTKVSTVDPGSGYYHRDDKEKGFMYLDHRTVDGLYNLIVDVHITPGNVHDSRPYLGRLHAIMNRYGFKVKQVGLDSGYYSWEIMEACEALGIFSVIGYRRVNKSKDHKKFVYRDVEDVIVCPIGCVLPLQNIDRLGYKQYFDRQQCQGCPLLQQCASNGKYRVIRRHVKAEVVDRSHERRLSERGKVLYARRKTTVERSFADSKQNHGYRYAMHRGLRKVQHYAWLSCASQNMKKIANLLCERDQQISVHHLKSIFNFISRFIETFFYLKRKMHLI